MHTEKHKMLSGQLYNASDPDLIMERQKARLLLKQLNDSGDDQPDVRKRLLKDLLPFQGENLWIEPPFYCDYGSNIIIGSKVYFNFNCTILDVMKVSIGDNVLFGPSVHIYTALHPINWKDRATGLEFAKPVTIGSDIWFGGGVIVCPGVVIGDRSVIGAGSVVTRDIPADVFAAGNPCRVIKSLMEEG